MAAEAGSAGSAGGGRPLKRCLFLAPLLAIAGCRPPAPGPAAHAALPKSASAPFVEAAAARGLDFKHRSGAGEAMNIVQTSAGGCGVLDYDNDGWLDLYLVQGQHAPGKGGGNRLYRNRGDGTFEDVTEKAGVRGRGYGMACAAGDFDADGWTDLYVCNNGASELYRNRGDGTFEEVGERLGAAVKGCSVGAVFADLDGDRWPDLYVARYVEVGQNGDRLCRMNDVPTSCGPQQYPSQPGVFLRNLRGKGFRDETVERGLVNDGRAMAVSVLDANGDGKLDLLVTNDTTANTLFLAGPGGKFRNDALAAGVAYGDLGHAEGNMGCDFGDSDGDGDFDLFIGTMQNRMSVLYRHEARGAFTLATRSTGLAEATSSVVTYGLGFLDFDQDGDLDLFQSNGHVQNRIQEIDPAVTFHQPRQLFENLGDGTFRDRTPQGGPALGPGAGRGAACGDLDNDGDVDVVVNNLDGSPALLINQAEQLGRHWLSVRLEGKAPNRSPEGAVVRLTAGDRRLVRHLHRAYSYAATNDPRVHFGLGDLQQVEALTVEWPGGRAQEVRVPQVDREIVVREP